MQTCWMWKGTNDQLRHWTAASTQRRLHRAVGGREVAGRELPRQIIVDGLIG